MRELHAHYMNDAPVDVGIKNNVQNPVAPIKGGLAGTGHRRIFGSQN